MTDNIFIDTISRFRKNTTVQELVTDFKDQIRLKIFKKTTLQPASLIKKFTVLQKKYAKANRPQLQSEWQENQRKIFLLFILAYSRLHFKKLSEITHREWNDISNCFGRKTILLMRYEAKCLEKNSQRVRWTEKEETILESCIRSELSGKWSQISRVLYFKTEGEHFKTAKQCREHWFNHLNKNIKRGDWTVHEDLAILNLVLQEGHHWSKIVQSLAFNRTEHMIKNRFGSLLTCIKKLHQEGRQDLSETSLIESLIKELTDSRSEIESVRPSPSEQNQREDSPKITSKEGCEDYINYSPCQKTENKQNDRQKSEQAAEEDNFMEEEISLANMQMESPPKQEIEQISGQSQGVSSFMPSYQFPCQPMMFPGCFSQAMFEGQPSLSHFNPIIHLMDTRTEGSPCTASMDLKLAEPSFLKERSSFSKFKGE